MKSDWKPTLPPFRKHKKEIYKSLIKTADYIYQVGETPALREKSTSIKINKIQSAEYQAKIAYLKNCLQNYRKLTGKGRGLAGVQVGINEQILITYMPDTKEQYLTIINPQITKESKEKYRFYESCLSAAPAFVPVVRSTWIEFEYYDEYGKRQVWDTKADTDLGRMCNRVFEHEIDHLLGILNIDRVQSKDIIYESDPNFYQTATFQEVEIKK